MKQKNLCFLVLLFCFLGLMFPSFVFAQEVTNNVMSLYSGSDDCYTPVEYYGFDAGTKVMNWVEIYGLAGDYLYWEWYSPSGYFTFTSHTAPADYECARAWFDDGLNTTESGQWTVYFYRNGKYLSQKTFYVYCKSKFRPVVLIHGIMDSVSSCLFDSTCPTIKFSVPGIDKTYNIGPEWVFNPLEFDYLVDSYHPTFKSLIAAFKSVGYSENMIYQAAYDWRKMCRVSSNILTSKIDEAKKATGWNSVDIVCHSMGCIVTAEYLLKSGRSDVNKVAAIGPPFKGSSYSYYVWEGGDFSIYGYLEKTFLYGPLISLMKIGSGWSGYETYQFIWENIHSVSS